MHTLEKTLVPQRLTADRFRKFGRVALPPRGEALARTEAFAYWSDCARYLVDGETEIGYCTAYAGDGVVTWMERHARTPELLIPANAPFILPVMDGEERVEAFRVEPGEAVVIGEGVWHSACLPIEGPEATYFVIFRRGTPHEDVEKVNIPPVEVNTTG